MTIYGLGVVNCLLSYYGRLPRIFPVIVAGVALGWAALLAPGVIREVSLPDLFASFGMMNLAVEEAREMLAPIHHIGHQNCLPESM